MRGYCLVASRKTPPIAIPQTNDVRDFVQVNRIGRHPNDRMLSFYSRSPSGFDVEFGCGGTVIDDDTWAVQEISRASLWGHQRPA